MTIKSTTLPSGLRVITDCVNEMDSVAVGVWTDVGTRHEDLDHNGVAHVVEHMMFKGTPTRSALDISEQIESVGGQVNAYTSRENTAYYIHLLKDDLTLALDVLADIVQNPLFPEEELDKERQVIIQEIGMTNDTPDDLVFDNYQETAYPKQALGAPILGTAEIVSGLQRDTLFDYVKRFYTPGRLVVSAAGGLDHDAFCKTVEAAFSALPEDSSQGYLNAAYKGGEHRAEKSLEQSHVVLGFRGVSRCSENYYAAVLLSTILGGGMSSRLFQEVREKRGLVYSVFAAHTAYHDDGQLEIYAGTGPERLPELMPVLCVEVRKMMQNCVQDDELARAKAQIKASILMSRESMLARANRQAKHLLNFGTDLDIQNLVSKVDAVNGDDVCKLAQQIFGSKPTLAALGPLEQLESYEAIVNRLAA